MTVNVRSLRKIVSEIEDLEQATRKLNAKKATIYKQARKADFDPKALKETIRKRRLDPGERETHDTLVKTYLVALEEPRPSSRGRVRARKDNNTETAKEEAEQAPGVPQRPVESDGVVSGRKEESPQSRKEHQEAPAAEQGAGGEASTTSPPPGNGQDEDEDNLRDMPGFLKRKKEDTSVSEPDDPAMF